MTIEQEEAIKILEHIKKEFKGNAKAPNINSRNTATIKIQAIETALNMLKEKDNLINEQLKENLRLQSEIQQKDNAVKRIINRLEHDIERISKSKAENRWDDYRRCRLKAYKTKTKEIKKYIEEQYFERKSEE